ncbi:Cupredoxin [Vreelandella sp. GE22]
MALSTCRILAGSARAAVLTLLAMASYSYGAVITVSDTRGQPLEDAVVEVYSPYQTDTLTEEGRIYQRNAAFHPRVLAVPVGSFVSFPNQDTTRHHVYSFSPAKTFELNLYLQETPPPIEFDQSGIVVLGCNIHDNMQAFIVVSEAPYVQKTGADGVLHLPELPPGEHRVRVWHPQLDDRQEVWWEGEITQHAPLDVRLELNALPPVAPSLSPLQERFRQATGS